MDTKELMHSLTAGIEIIIHCTSIPHNSNRHHHPTTRHHLQPLHATPRPWPPIRPPLRRHTQPGTQAKETDSLRRRKIIQRIQQNLQMPRKVLLVLLQNRKQFLQLLVVDGVDVDAGGLVEVAGEAGGVVGEEGAGAGDFGVDL